MTAFLFVYGTLRNGFAHPMAGYLARQGRHLGTARVRGQLFNLGRYPGILESSSEGDVVKGDVYQLPDDGGETLEKLDRYENGESLHPGEFDRQITSVEMDSGAILQTWIYWFRGEVKEENRIQGGDWMVRG